MLIFFFFQVILAGDHKQLPPTIVSVDAAKKGLELTLMERVVNAQWVIFEFCPSCNCFFFLFSQ